MQLATTHEQHCFENADHFTAVRGRGAKRTKVVCGSFTAAKDHAERHGDGRTMIYAVTAEGSSAHICNA